MAKSKQQLIERSLQEIGVLVSGQAASAEDAKTVSDEIGPVLSKLASRDVYSFGDPDATDDEAFIPLAVIIGNSVAKSFGMEKDLVEILRAEAELRDINFVEPRGIPQDVEYF